jgi:hypothetical protein
MLFKDIPREVAIWMVSGAIVLMLAALASYIHTYVNVMKNRKRPDSV